MANVLEEMSSEELFELAKSRKIEEEKSIREKLKAEIDTLRKERREMSVECKKKLSQLDDKIEKLRDQISGTGTPSRNKSSFTNISANVLNILQTHKKMSTKALQAELSNNGIAAANLSQTLAYLKRQGKITSPERAVYAIT